MNATLEGPSEELLPKYPELVQLVQMPKPERFAELARIYNTDDDTEEFSGRRKSRDQYAGKIICAARTIWEQQPWRRQQTFPDYFARQYGCRPSNHGQTCAKTYRSLVLTGKIAESDYDGNSANAIETACQVIAKVNEDFGHPAVAAAASILRQRSQSAVKELKALLDRLAEDPKTGQLRLLDHAPAADLDAEPLTHTPALELAFKIADEGHQSVLSAPLEKIAASTPDLAEARSLATAAANILAGLSNNRDEHGQRRFSDEVIAGWKAPEAPKWLVTQESLKTDYAVAKKKVQEIESKLIEAGIVPSQPATSRQTASLSVIANSAAQENTLKRWRGAEQRVLELLRSWGWEVEDVSLQKLGYDIEGKDLEGEDAFVEVKSIDRSGQAFTFTPREGAVATEKRGAYRLALVRLTNTHLEVEVIRDPMKQMRFTLIHKQVAHECVGYEFRPKRYPLD